MNPEKSFSIRRISSPAIALAAGAVIYPLLEIAWRGRSHFSMSIAGGICLFVLYFVNLRFKEVNLAVRCIMGAYIITAVELVFGIVFNILLDMHIWNYSGVPYNLLGQVCLPYSVVWFFLCFPAFAICTLIDRRKIFLRRA